MCEIVPQHDHQIENHENSTHQWVAEGTITVTHVSSKCNVSTFLLKKCAASTIHSCVGLASDYLKWVHNLKLDVSIATLPIPLSPVLLNQLHSILLTARESLFAFLIQVSVYLLCLILHLRRQLPYSLKASTSILFAGNYERSYWGCSYTCSHTSYPLLAVDPHLGLTLPITCVAPMVWPSPWTFLVLRSFIHVFPTQKEKKVWSV